jgi:hypothetical protein
MTKENVMSKWLSEDPLLKRLASADPYEQRCADEVELGVPEGLYLAAFESAISGEEVPKAVVNHRGRRPTMKKQTHSVRMFTLVLVGASALSLAGAAIADATSRSTASLRTEPRLSSSAMLNRGGRHALSRTIGRIASSDELATSETLGDGTQLSPPPLDASTAVSQDDAWSAFVAYGTPPDVFAQASTPAPTIELAGLSKTSSPNGGTLSNVLVWAIQYQDISVYNPRAQNAAETSPETGYFYVFVSASTGQVIYTTAHAAPQGQLQGG